MKLQKILIYSLTSCALLVSGIAIAQQGAPDPNTQLFRSPLAESTTSSPYGWSTHPISGERYWHSGMDMVAPLGTPVLAPGDGEILLATSEYSMDEEYGTVIILRHTETAYKEVLRTFFAHLNSIDVEVGQKVSQGQRIGTVGQTGRANSPHLHYEVWRGVNPWFYIMSENIER